MQSVTIHARVGTDGILKLEMPIGLTNTELEIILILNPVAEARSPLEWPPGFFTEIVGGWKGRPLIRESQGTYESRSELK